MNPSFILDCSMTMAWCFAGQATAGAAKVQNRLEKEAALVPQHWFLEVTNVLAMADKHRRMTAARSAEFLALLETMDIQTDQETATRAFAHLLPLCRSYGLTSYDSAYLELALRRRLPLATFDRALRSAAKQLGIEVLG